MMPCRPNAAAVLAAAALLCASLACAAPCRAAELKVLTAGAFKPMVAALAPDYARQGGDALRIDNDTVGALARRLAAGEPCDVAILTAEAFAPLAAQGVVAPDSVRPLARVGIGVAVRQGAGRPDISTVAAFEAALRAAPSVAYIDPASGGSSGIYLDGLFKRLGLARDLAGKAVLVHGGLVGERLVDGRAALAVHQISELLAVPGTELVGPLPEALQNYTRYAAAVCAHGQAARAAAFIDYLHGPAAAALFQAKGMEPAR